MKRLLASVFAAALLVAQPALADSGLYFRSAVGSATTTGVVSTIESPANPLKYFTIQVKGTGAAASAWNVAVEGSIDGTNFSKIMEHASGDGDADGSVKASTNTAAAFPVTYVRTKVISVSLGSATAIAVSLIATQ